MPTSAWTHAYRQRRFDYNPWVFEREASATEKTAQARHQRALAEVVGVVLGEQAYLAPSASITGRPGAALTLGARGFVGASAYVTDAVTLGDDCSINPFATLRGPITGGDGVRIGAYACLVGFNHGFADPDTPIFRQPHTSKGIVLGHDIWIGAHATIVDGVRVGSHCLIAAGAVVTKDVPDYAIVGGNPARVLRMRKVDTHGGVAADTTANAGPVPVGLADAEGARPPLRRASPNLARALVRFGRKADAQADVLLCAYQVKAKGGGVAFVNEAGGKKRVRPWCDAVEVAAMFGRGAPGYTAAEWVTRLRSFQDPATGLVPEHIPEHRRHDPVEEAHPDQAWRYNTMIVNYALECLGSNLAWPVVNAAAISPARLKRCLEALPWAVRAWHAGDWIDCYASCVLPNAKYFGQQPPLSRLFDWLERHVDAQTGLWGRATPETRLLQPVNGFYRLTRGTYAQYGRLLPMPERAIDTVLAHAEDREFFAEGRENACNVLDVVHPLWLCLKQTSYRRAEVESWMARRLPLLLRHWVDERGFDFLVARKQPSLQGTEMWLSIVWLMADILGDAESLGYRPKGVHRPEAVGVGLTGVTGEG